MKNIMKPFHPKNPLVNDYAVNDLVQKHFKANQDVLDRKFLVGTGKISNKEPFQCKVEPLDNIQFDCDEEIKEPIAVELRHKDTKVLKKSHPRSCCYDLKSLQKYCL